MKKKIKKLERTAFHEAGHAVMEYSIQRKKAKRVTIIPNEEKGYLGLTKSNYFPNINFNELDEFSSKRLRFEKKIVCYLAGYCSEKHFFPKSRPTWHSDDFHNARYIINRISHDEGGPISVAYFRYLLALTKGMLHRELINIAIKAVAMALLEKKTLSGEEVHDVIQKAWKDAFEQRNRR